MRCKLISPTNLMLEHPLTNPVKEIEFEIIGQLEFQRLKINILSFGIFLGALFFTLIFILLKLYFGEN